MLILQYKQGVPELLDIGSMVYANKSFNVATEDTNLRDLIISPDGSKFWLTGTTSDSIHEYAMTTSGDISTGLYTGDFIGIGGNNSSLAISSDGTKMFGMKISPSISIVQYNLTTPWTIGDGFTSGTSLSVPLPVGAGIGGMDMKPDGTKMYILYFNNATYYSIHRYNLSTPWDTSTAVLDVGQDVNISTTVPFVQCVKFDATGSRVFIAVPSYYTIWQLDLTTPWDVSSGNITNNGVSYNYSAQSTNASFFDFSEDESIMYLSDDGGNQILQYTV